MPNAAAFSFRRTFGRYMRDSVRHYGVIRTADELIAALYRVLRNRMPWRRRADFGDLDFDWEHQVDTTRSNVGLRTQLVAGLAGHEYCPTEPWQFEQIMQALPVRLADFTFIDLGSGKGRTLLMAAAYHFKRILGVEFLPELHRIAGENIALHASSKQHGRQVESICMDAPDFSFPPEPTVLYFFNPFPEPVLAAVLANVRRSLEDCHRPFYVAYRYPEYERLLGNCAWLEKIAGTQQWAVFRAVPELSFAQDL